jgi:Preprotein translocase subunit SecA (ATPase, RNA helicase)
LEGATRARAIGDASAHRAPSYHRDKQYVVVEDKVQIVDEFTGRIAYGRSWQHGLHQLIEMKEGCTITGRDEVLASITYQRFFSRYLRLAGMSGTCRRWPGSSQRFTGWTLSGFPPTDPRSAASAG